MGNSDCALADPYLFHAASYLNQNVESIHIEDGALNRILAHEVWRVTIEIENYVPIVALSFMQSLVKLRNLELPGLIASRCFL